MECVDSRGIRTIPYESELIFDCYLLGRNLPIGFCVFGLIGRWCCGVVGIRSHDIP